MRVSVLGFTATNGNSTNRCGGRVPVQIAAVIALAESITTCSCHTGTSANDVTRTPAGTRSSTRVVATAFSLGTRSTYFSYAPGVDALGKTTACAHDSVGSSAAAMATVATPVTSGRCGAPRRRVGCRIRGGGARLMTLVRRLEWTCRPHRGAGRTPEGHR